MSSSASIRQATGDDVHSIVDLAKELGYPSTVSAMKKRLDRLLRADDHRVLVACNDQGCVVGWIHVFIAFLVESDPFAEIGGFVVAQKHRGQGVGSQLLRYTEAWVQTQNITKLRVRTRQDRADAHVFYEKQGFAVSKCQSVFDKCMVM